MRTSIAFGVMIVAFAGCGGGGKGLESPSNTGGADLGDPWGAVTKGATFTVDNWLEGEKDVEVLVATVTDVQATGGGRTITIAWTRDGKPLEGASLPGTVTVGASSVKLGDQDYPVTPQVLPDGRYTERGDDGSTCYGEGPAPGSTAECEDVCFAELCVHPTHGIMGGAGTWWPNYVVFARPDLRKK